MKILSMLTSFLTTFYSESLLSVGPEAGADHPVRVEHEHVRLVRKNGLVLVEVIHDSRAEIGSEQPRPKIMLHLSTNSLRNMKEVYEAML